MDGNGTGERDNNEEGTPLTALRQKQLKLKAKREEANTTTGSESLAVTMMTTTSTSSTRVAEYLNKLGKPLDRLFTRCV